MAQRFAMPMVISGVEAQPSGRVRPRLALTIEALTVDGTRFSRLDACRGEPCPASTALSARLLEVTADMAQPRHYLIGLPVLVTVDDDGSVTYDLCHEDADSAVLEEYGYGEGQDIVLPDVERIKADIDKRYQEGKL